MNHSNKNPASQNLHIWFCESCRNVHFKTQNVMLDFSAKQFANLTNIVLEIFQNHFDPLEIQQISGNSEFCDDILISDTIF